MRLNDWVHPSRYWVKLTVAPSFRRPAHPLVEGVPSRDPGEYLEGPSWGVLGTEPLEVKELAMKRRALLLSLAFVVLLQAKAGSASDLGLVGYWSFDDGTATDISGHGNNGVLHGCTPTQGVHGGALSFNGTSDYIDFGNPSDLNPTNAISVAVWFRPVSFNGTGNDPIVDKGYTSHTNPYYQYHLGVVGDLYPQGASFGFYLALGGQLRYVTTPAAFWTPNHWYHLAATYDGSMMKLYMDGALIDSLSVTGSLTNYGENMLSGRYNNISAYLPGTIDELRIYDRAISAAEVDSLSFNPEVSGFVVERYAKDRKSVV